MANKMIIDASHPEETRVVVLRGNRVEEFDFESASKKPLRGNIYLAKVTRVEPSLQAAFVDYGGNRHGFLAFSEIHPDYYQIPVADRQALLEEEAISQRDDEEEPNAERRSRRHRRPRHLGSDARTGDGDVLSESTPLEDRVTNENESAAGTQSAEKTGEIHASASVPLSEALIAAESDDVGALGPNHEVSPPQASDPRPTTSAVEFAEPEAASSEQADTPIAEGDDIASFTFYSEHETARDEAREARARQPDRGPDEHPQDDDHEVTTLDGGTEERFAPS